MNHVKDDEAVEEEDEDVQVEVLDNELTPDDRTECARTDPRAIFRRSRNFMPPMRFNFYLSKEEWMEVDPEIVGTPVRENGSRCLGSEWTNIFARHIKKLNSRCVLICPGGSRCRNPLSRKRRAPWFAGKLFCKVPGCSILYDIAIRPLPNELTFPLLVEVTGSGKFDHSACEKVGFIPRRPIKGKEKYVKRTQKKEQNTEKKRISLEEPEQRAARYGKLPRKLPQLRNYPSRNIFYASKYDEQLRTYNSSADANGYEMSDAVSSNSDRQHSPPYSSQKYASPPSAVTSNMETRRKRVSWSRLAPFPAAPAPALSASPEMEERAVLLQSLQIKYYRMKIYRTELEIRRFDPTFDHRIFDQEQLTESD